MPAQPQFRQSRRPEERVQALGVTMDLIKPEELFLFMRQSISAGCKSIIANHNLHSIYLYMHDEEFKAFYDIADVIEVDSLPLIFWARLIGRPSRRFHRCTYLEWRNEFWNHATALNWRVFFVGGQPGVSDLAKANIQKRWPQVQLETQHGYFDSATDSAENKTLIRKIRAFSPDVILVGMGMPRQETWVLRNYDALPAAQIITVGGAFDYEAGVQIACPRWIGRLGVEWLFRLAMNPPRLFRRYCIEPISLLPPALRDIAAALGRRDSKGELQTPTSPRLRTGAPSASKDQRL